MLITDYAVVKMARDPQTRQWTILGQTNDIPGNCRPGTLYPIVARVNDDGELEQIPRTHANGWIDALEEFGYVKMSFWKRKPHDEVMAVMTLRVDLTQVRL